MKITLLVIAVLLSSQIFAQTSVSPHPSDSTTNSAAPLEFAETVAVEPGATKKELFKRAYAWCSTVLKDVKAPGLVIDEKAGEISFVDSLELDSIVDHSTNLTHLEWKSFCKFKFTIIVKDGMYQYIINELQHVSLSSNLTLGPITQNEFYKESGPAHKWYNRVYKQQKKSAVDRIQAFISGLKAAMLKSSK